MTRRYPGWDLDPDPLDVQPADNLERVQMPDRPAPLSFAWFVIGVFCGVLLLAGVMVLGQLIDAAPRSAPDPTVDPTRLERPTGGVADPSQAVLDASGPVLSGVPHGTGGAPYTLGQASSVLEGVATWYDVGPGFYAAAGPKLREHLADWRGRIIEARLPGTEMGVLVELVDWCACADRDGHWTLLDLSPDAFVALAGHLGPGVIGVEIVMPPSVLPPTDTPEHPDDTRMRLEVRDDEVYR